MKARARRIEKSEGRRSKSERRPKPEIRIRGGTITNLGVSFGLRVWGFGLTYFEFVRISYFPPLDPSLINTLL